LGREPPLDAITSGEVAMLGEEYIHVRRLAGSRIPIVDAPLLIRQSHKLPALRIAHHGNHPILAIARQASADLIAVEFQNLAAGIEAGHLLLLVAEPGGG